MKTQQTSSKGIILNDVEYFHNDIEENISIVDINNAKDIGFVGKAFIYEHEVFIDTFTGEGYNIVIRKMKSYIDWYSGKIRLSGFEREDIKQLIVMILLDGIRRYNPNLKIKLSTFLYVHIRNRLISRIKEETRQSLNATYNEPLYKFICVCGNSVIKNKNEILHIVCILCNAKIDNKWIIRPEHNNPSSLDNILTSTNDDDNFNETDKVALISYNGRLNHLIDFFGKIDTTDDVDRNLDFSNILNDEDLTTRKIAELMYSKDYSITDAAKEVGLSCWAASLRLKKLKSKKVIRDFFLPQP